MSINYTLSSSGSEYILNINTTEYQLSLSRTGGQGAQGPSNYDLAVQEGYTGTLAEWLEELSATTTALQAFVDLASASEAAAELSATNAATSETNASNSESAASASQSAALISENAAEQSQLAAATSEVNAGISEANASNSESIATTKASEASVSASNALASENNAATSESNAATSASNASASETNAEAAKVVATEQAGIATSAANSASTSETNAHLSELAAASSETNSATSETNAATSETNAATSAANALASESAASASEIASASSEANALASKNAAAISASSASTSASTATTKASEASSSAAEANTYRLNAADSAATAATQATQAGIKADQAASSAAAAASSEDLADLHASNAELSSATAAVKASEALTSANNASDSAASAAYLANNALTSENNAASSAENAAASEVAAASSANSASTSLAAINLVFDNFDDRYLGAKASDPTLDNDGNPLLLGAVYWNTTDSTLKFYNGNSWESPSVSAANSAAVALGYANTATAKANEAFASANSALDSKNSASLSETNAASSESAAAVYAATATTQAGIATTQAGIATTKAGEALTSADNAATSESNAATSETNAEQSAIDAAASAVTAATTSLTSVGAVTYDMTGFVNRTDSSISFVAGSRTLTLTPINPTSIYYRGALHTVSSPLSLVISNISGGRYIWFDPTTEALVEGGIGDYAGIIINALVAYIYWDAVNQKAIIVGDERHSAQRDTQWHLSKHIEQGAVWRAGGNLSYTLDTDTAITLGFSTPISFADEDLVHEITHSSSPTNPYEQVLSSNAIIPTLYLNGTSYVQTTASSVPWVAGASLARYNPVTSGSGSLVDVTNNYYMSYWIVATNDSVYPIKTIMGHIQSNKIEDIEAETFGDYGLPVPELVPMYHIVLRVDNAYVNNAPHVVISKVLRLTSRESTATSAFSASSHDALAGRGADNQHPISAITGLQAALDSKESADATILKDADIGVNIQAYNSNTVIDASYVHTDNNYTTSEKNKLAGIEDNATGDQSASEILALVKTVDGAGSGLDADLLDGQSSNYYATATSVTDALSSANTYTDTAISGLSTVATTGSYNDLSDKPTIVEADPIGTAVAMAIALG